jgi:hypothetical protein
MHLSPFIVTSRGELCLELNASERKLMREAFNFNGRMLKMNAIRRQAGKCYLVNIIDAEEAE